MYWPFTGSGGTQALNWQTEVLARATRSLRLSCDLPFPVHFPPLVTPSPSPSHQHQSWTWVAITRWVAQSTINTWTATVTSASCWRPALYKEVGVDVVVCNVTDCDVIAVLGDFCMMWLKVSSSLICLDMWCKFFFTWKIFSQSSRDVGSLASTVVKYVYPMLITLICLGIIIII